MYAIRSVARSEKYVSASNGKPSAPVGSRSKPMLIEWSALITWRPMPSVCRSPMLSPVAKIIRRAESVSPVDSVSVWRSALLVTAVTLPTTVSTLAGISPRTALTIVS